MYAMLLFSSLFVSAADTDSKPKYVVARAPGVSIEAILTHQVTYPNLKAIEWVVAVPVAPTCSNQENVKTKLTPTGKVIQADPLRNLVFTLVPAKTKELKTTLSVQVEYQAKLFSRKLRPLKEGETIPKVEALSEKEEKAYLQAVGDFDHTSKAFQTYLQEHKLLKQDTEDPVAFAQRVFLHLRSHLKYDFDEKQNRLASNICKVGQSDCGGMSNVFVSAMRANKIPARTLVGRWALSSDPKEKVGGRAYGQWHVKAEFYVDQVGWIPVDVASSVIHDKSKTGLRYFGQDLGDFFTMHLDGSLEIDTQHFGKQKVTILQGPAVWVAGEGNLDNPKETENWQVKKK